MACENATVFVVDDDDGIRASVRALLQASGYRVEAFGSAEDFLGAFDPERPGCIVLDVLMTGMDGLALQERLVARNATIPIVFVTGHGDVATAVKAMLSGAVDFLEKPFREQDLLERVAAALKLDAQMRERAADRDVILSKLELLTPREREVMQRVVDGETNKAIAIDLGLSERTVEVHRARVMRKMEAESVPQLVRMTMTVRD